MEESDEEMDGEKGNAGDEVEEEEEEIVESDIELEGEIVEPDNDPSQKVFFFSSYQFSFLFSLCFFVVVGVCAFELMEDLIFCRWEMHRSRSLKRAVMPRRLLRLKPWKPFLKVLN